MNILCISDTHGQHRNLVLPHADVLIHSGDFSGDEHGQAAFRDFVTWFNDQPHEHKILVAGNHDWCFDKWNEQARALFKQHAPSAHYLEDSGVSIDGYNFWGSPVTPRFFDWAFNRDRGAAIQKHWDLIPYDTDVLITHGPAWNRLDDVRSPTTHDGDKDLANTIDNKLVSLKVHTFGHFHYKGGYHLNRAGVMYINASVVNEQYQLKNNGQVYELPPKEPSHGTLR